MRSVHLVTVLVVVTILVGVSGCEQGASDTHTADAESIRTAEIEAVRAFNAGDIDGVMAVYPEDAIWFPPNAAVVKGAEGIRELASQLAAMPGFAFGVDPHTVEIARAGDLAYLIGDYDITVNDPNGNPVTEYGKFVEVWRKHPDNSWNHVLAIWNSNDSSKN